MYEHSVAWTSLMSADRAVCLLEGLIGKYWWAECRLQNVRQIWHV